MGEESVRREKCGEFIILRSEVKVKWFNESFLKIVYLLERKSEK